MPNIDTRKELAFKARNIARQVHGELVADGSETPDMLALDEIEIVETPEGVTIRFFRAEDEPVISKPKRKSHEPDDDGN